MDLNTTLFRLINNLVGRWPWLDATAVFCAHYLIYVMIVGVLIFPIINFKKWRDMAIVALGSAIVARFGLTVVIRWLYYHQRPYLILDKVHLLLLKETEASFPSGHTIFAFAIAMAIYIYNKKASVWFFVAASLIGIFRVYVGVHWPYDILAGAVLGILVAWISNVIYHRFKHLVGLK